MQLIRTKTCCEVIEFYYYWKMTSHYQQWKKGFEPLDPHFFSIPMDDQVGVLGVCICGCTSVWKASRLGVAVLFQLIRCGTGLLSLLMCSPLWCG